MAWFQRRKPTDPLSARQKKLEAEMALLQDRLQKLATEAPEPMASGDEAPKGRGRDAFAAPLLPPPTPPPGRPNGHYNEQGIRKWDISAAWSRLLRHLRGPTGNNPQLTKMLAAGSIHGLRPLRHEKRVARNRSIALFVTLLLILWGIAYVYLRNSR